MKKIDDNVLIKNFKKGNIKTENISNILIYNQFFTNLSAGEKLILTRNNIHILHEKLGRNNLIHEGLECKYNIWIVDYENVLFFIYSSKNGTHIEYINNLNPNIDEILTNFLIEFFEILMDK